METILIKTILCSGLLLGIYYLFLSKERTFIFNRYYLIVALVFSLIIPFFTIETQQVQEQIPKTVFTEEAEKPILQTPIISQEENFDYGDFLLIVNCIVTGILLLKFGYSFFKIKRLKGRKTTYQNRKIILLENDLAPFSFWNTIYLSENYFKDSRIDDSIFLHEEIHIKQKHSADILFIEIVKAVFWFNPFIYFYKKAIINNHEFIADEAVIAENKNVKIYQELILQEILKQQNLQLIHQFNFNNTKKRFIMMTKKNSKFATAKKCLALPVFIVLTFAFAEKVYANDNTGIDDSKIILNAKKQSYDHSEAYDQPRNVDAKKDISIKFKESDTGEFLLQTKKDTIKPRQEANAKTEENIITNSESSIPPPPPPSAKFIQAEFPGGVSNIRKKAIEIFDASYIKNDQETLKSTVYITIDEKGKVEKIIGKGTHEDFNKEAERSVRLALGETLWKPATDDGKPVRTAFSLPMALHFENPKKAQ
ncbi:M56 family metallopeptidase [Chryseobacterium echinoideorum]|uniref:M56 family metallopeptidase n=1 Tax=Chryseobacterium echinoideorum TaxID=1549648 RepID=UPI001184DF8D|nr:M56 family metallopeptidase [Chryseobacterium echinoideorum]